MKKFLVLLVSLFALSPLVLGVTTAAAQPVEPTGLSNVHVWINPEYDNPLQLSGENLPLLVMMEGQITGTQAPATVRFLVPSGAELYSAGSKDASGKYTGGPPARKPSSVTGWDEISYQLTSSTFRVEYYYEAINGFPNKTISCDVRFLYPVANLNAFVQQPRNSDNFTVSPSGGQAGIDGDGLKILTYSFTNVAQNSPVHFDIAYTRTDTNPSVGAAAAPATGKSNTGLLVGVLAGVAVVAAGGILWATRRRQPTSRAARRRAAVAGATGRFCSQCGQRLDRPTSFCPHCGAKQE